MCDSIDVNNMKILRQETLEHDNLYDSLLLYEMGGVYIVSWNCFRKGCFMGYREISSMNGYATLEEATEEFERKLKVLSWQVKLYVVYFSYSKGNKVSFEAKLNYNSERGVCNGRYNIWNGIASW